MASSVDGKTLVKINKWHMWFWMLPGFGLNYLLRNQLWWTNFMSWFAIVLTVGTMWAASRTEMKQDAANED